MGFGYKTAWLAIRASSPDALLSPLNARTIRDCTWAEGSAQAYRQELRTFFTTRIVDGWILCSGQSFFDFADMEPAKLMTFLTTLSTSVDGEVQMFYTHRVSEGHGWARTTVAGVQRVFRFANGAVEFEFGQPDAHERTREPNEEDVIRLAGDWSIDPTRLGDDTPDQIGGTIMRERWQPPVSDVASEPAVSPLENLNWTLTTPATAEAAARGNILPDSLSRPWLSFGRPRGRHRFTCLKLL